MWIPVCVHAQGPAPALKASLDFHIFFWGSFAVMIHIRCILKNSELVQVSMPLD